MKLVPYGELGIPCSQEYLASLTTSDKINKEIDKISLSDYEPVTRTEDNNDVVEPQSYIEWLNNRLDELKQLEAEKQAQIEAQKKQQEEEQKANILEFKETSNTQEEYKSLTQEEYQSLILKLQQKDALIERLLKYAQSLKNNSNTQCEDVQSSDNNEDVQSSDKSEDVQSSDKNEDVQSDKNEDEPPASNEESKDVHLDKESQESLDSEDDTSTVYESNN